MRWLMLALVVSLIALLVASAGIAHHIWRERTKRRALRLTADRVEDPETEEAP